MIHPKTIFRIIGSLLLLLAGIFVLFGIASPFLEGNDLFGFLASALATTLAGLWCLIIGKGTKGDFSRRDSYITITSCWIAFALFGSLPYWLGGHIPSFTDAFFESMSGFTTTGSSIVPAVEELSHAALIWRSFTNWIGGMGVLVFVMAFVPLSGGNNLHIMKAESPGPSVSKLVPRIRTTALILYLIYIVLTLAEFILLLCGGMNAFEALCTWPPSPSCHLRNVFVYHAKRSFFLSG